MSMRRRAKLHYVARQRNNFDKMSTVSSLEGESRKSKGAVLFTGPDGIGDYKVTVENQFYIGHGSMSPEASSDTQYLCRAAPGIPHPTARSVKVGEVGWGVPGHVDHTLLKTGHQIMLKEFRQAVEDRHTHAYQSPYYPAPSTTSTCTTTTIAVAIETDPIETIQTTMSQQRLYIQKMASKSEDKSTTSITTSSGHIES